MKVESDTMMSISVKLRKGLAGNYSVTWMKVEVVAVMFVYERD